MKRPMPPKNKLPRAWIKKEGMREPDDPPKPGRVRKKCASCGVYFTAPKAWDDRLNNCSVECKKRATQLKSQKEAFKAMSKAVALAEKHRLTPGDSALIRGAIANYVQNHITLANQVVSGEVEWSPTQARVFATLLNKVVPDLNASYVQHEHSQKSLVDLSRDELERIAAGIEVIDIQAEPVDD